MLDLWCIKVLSDHYYYSILCRSCLCYLIVVLYNLGSCVVHQVVGSTRNLFPLMCSLSRRRRRTEIARSNCSSSCRCMDSGSCGKCLVFVSTCNCQHFHFTYMIWGTCVLHATDNEYLDISILLVIYIIVSEWVNLFGKH